MDRRRTLAAFGAPRPWRRSARARRRIAPVYLADAAIAPALPAGLARGR